MSLRSILMPLVRHLCAIIGFSAVVTVSALADRAQVTLGVTLPLTGGLATIGNAVRNGIELARSDDPALFEQIHLEYIDTQHDPATTLSGYHYLLQQLRPSAVLHMGDALPVRQLIERSDLAVINFSFESTSAGGSSLIVRSFNHTGEYSAALAAEVSKRAISPLAIIESEGRFFAAMAEGTATQLVNAGRIDRQSVSLTQQDFRSLILRLKQRGVRGVGLFLLPDQLRSFTRQARELNFYPTYFGTDLFESATQSAEERALFEGALYPDNQSDPLFASRYRARYGTVAQLTFAASGYDMANVVAQLLREAPQLRGRELIQALMARPPHRGTLGVATPRHEKAIGNFFRYPIVVKELAQPGDETSALK